MYDDGMKVIGVIPARGNSERIPNKNLKKFNGKPLIAWAILSAKKSTALHRVIVSTDSPEIAKVARKYGAETPFLRPVELSGPAIGIEPALQHTYQWLLDNENYKADGIALLMPTNPLRQHFHIDKAVKLFKSKKADSVVAVNETPANHTPYWTLTKSDTRGVTLWNGKSLKKILTRRQDFPQKCYSRNDVIYVIKPGNLFERKPNLYGNNVELYDTGTLCDVDINTPEEWQDAEIKFQRLIRANK